MSLLAERTKAFDSSGIRKVFDLAAKMKDPINFSIGQPDFDVPGTIKDACIDAIRAGKNAYTVTQGVPALRDKLQARIDRQFGHADRKLLVTSGTSGALSLVMWSLINPGDEVLMFDPYFVMYPALTKLVGGVPVIIDTYPDFRIDLNKVADAITPRTKLILLNSPANPTGVVASDAETRGLAKLAAEKNVILVSDEIYSMFSFDQTLFTPAQFNDRTLVIDGFSKSHGMTGWRLGYVHGPAEIIETMTKLQQYTFVCAPQPVQWAGAVAMDVPMDKYVLDYKRKRDLIYGGLADKYEVVKPGGAFYIFPKAPGGSGSEFVTKAIENNVLIIPGSIFSRRDTHFRISYAASDETIQRGIDVLRRLA
ncbi:MAG: aminotransferase class I/II-fold pyridoxal phosphate-dependent enzyme [Planctomycetia bacterium]|nr:aminotransferase class I/II-fold pyridoxal phosphate-dependent enzyme [Planctomycetia bacterium]